MYISEKENITEGCGYKIIKALDKSHIPLPQTRDLIKV